MHTPDNLLCCDCSEEGGIYDGAISPNLVLNAFCWQCSCWCSPHLHVLVHLVLPVGVTKGSSFPRNTAVRRAFRSGIQHMDANASRSKPGWSVGRSFSDLALMPFEWALLQGLSTGATQARYLEPFVICIEIQSTLVRRERLLRPCNKAISTNLVQGLSAGRKWNF